VDKLTYIKDICSTEGFVSNSYFSAAVKSVMDILLDCF